MKLHIGCGKTLFENHINIDKREPADLIFDLDNLTAENRKLPFGDNTITEIIANDVLEHIHDTLGLMSELYRVAKNGCEIHVSVPCFNHYDAIDDQTHVRKFTPYSFRFFAQPWYHNNHYGYEADWEFTNVTMCCEPRWRRKMTEMTCEQAIDFALMHSCVCYRLRTVGVAQKPARPGCSSLATIPAINLIWL